MDIPRIALAVRQPWAWAIIHAGKTVENRTRFAMRHLQHIGPTAILASKGMTRDEYESAREFIRKAGGVECPAAADLVRGAIIGSVDMYERAPRADGNPWYIPTQSVFRLRDPVPCEPVPCDGRLGFWAWQPSGGEVAPALPWMLKAAARARVAAAISPTPSRLDPADFLPADPDLFLGKW